MKNILLPLLCAAVLCSCHKEMATVSRTEDHSKPVLAAPPPAASTISFSGYTWEVRDGVSPAGPGPNYWSSRNVWLDGAGDLHFKISRDPVTGRWSCAEITSLQSFGYGTYQFKIKGRVDQLDPNVVFGLFNYSGNDGYDEMDIEFARWGAAGNPNLNYTIWPAAAGFTQQSHVQSISLNGTYTTHRFVRTQNRVVFKSMHGFTDTDTNLFATATFTNPPVSISRLSMPVHINLWLFQGRVPLNNNEVELILSEFKYIP